MGNIRPSFIKIRAIRLVEELTDVSTKKLRNWIAGYVTRYRQRRTD